MRLRKKPWIGEALQEFQSFVLPHSCEENKGRWNEIFGRSAPLYVELGTGKGRFISEMAALHPHINFIGIEAQQDVLYYAAKKVAAKEVTNVRLLVFDINHIMNIFAYGEVDRFFINFCDPWPKNKHAKRRLTYRRFLEMYRQLIASGGEIHFKTDNEKLFEFSLNEFAYADLKMSNITFDLHNSSFAGNVMTEYEIKFSSQGGPIYRCEAQFLPGRSAVSETK